MALGKDLAKAWNSPGASIETRKKIIRLLVKEIIVDIVDDSLALVIHWQGGDHTQMTVKKNKIGQTRWTVEADVVELVRVLARQFPDMAIAAILNRSGKLTGRGATWTRTNVCGLRKTNDIPVYREGERAERGQVTLDEAADILKVSRATAYRMVCRGVLARPAALSRSTLDNPACRPAAGRRSLRRRGQAVTPPDISKSAAKFLCIIRTSPDEQYDAPTSLPANKLFFLDRHIEGPFCPYQPRCRGPLPLARAAWPQGPAALRRTAIWKRGRHR